MIFRRPIVSAILVGLVTLAVFLPSLNNGFVNWDDLSNLINNPGFRGFSWDHLHWMWTNQLTSHYIPLTWMSFGLDYGIWKEHAVGYHLTNVLLHAANAAVFFLLALAIFKRAFWRPEVQSEAPLVCGAGLASLLFSLHPLRVESVAWATERRDVLSGLFFLLALLIYVHAFPAEPKGSMPRKSYLICLALFAMSILSKEIAVTLPFVLLILDVYPLRRLPGPSGWFGPDARRVWFEKIPFFAVGLADGAVALHAGIRDHLVEPVAVLGLAARIAITVYGMAFYLLKTVVPIGLSPLYPLTRYKAALGAMPFQMSATVVLLITLICVVLRHRFPGLAAAWTASAVILLPVSGIIHNGFQIAADRYTYLACLSWALLAGAGFIFGWRALRHSSTGRALTAAGAVLALCTLSYLSYSQIAIWHDSDTLWSRAIAVEPSVPAHLNFAASLYNEGNTLGAIDQYRQAIVLWPDNAGIHTMLGGALLDMHQGEEAAKEFRLAVQIGPNPDAFNGLTYALVMQGKLDEAIGVLSAELRRNPGDTDARRNLRVISAMKESHEQNGSQILARESK